MIFRKAAIKQMSRYATIVLLLVSSLLFFIPATVAAEEGDTCPGSGEFFGWPTWYQYLPQDSECNVLPIRYGDDADTENPINLGATAGAVLLSIIEIMLWIAGVVAIGFVVYGGIRYTMSQGAPDKLQAARQTILNGIIGLVIAVLAVAIVNLVSNILS
jgi:hypothetical protein